MKGLAVVILAAGQGKRMKSKKAKVLHPLLGRAMIFYPLEAAAALKPDRIIVVVGVEGEKVKETLAGRKVLFAWQKEQLGTGHAVQSALPQLKDFSGDILVLYGDSPLLRPQTLASLVQHHRRTRADMTLLTACFADPTGYGRILRDQAGRITGIVEEKDCTHGQRRLKEGNPGIYVYQSAFLKWALPQLRNQNRQKEYYLTDVVGIAVNAGGKAESVLVEEAEEVQGVNSRLELAAAARLLSRRINEAHCRTGVSIEDTEKVYIETEVEIGPDTVIEAGARLLGKTRIGPGCMIEALARISDSVLGPGCVIEAGARVERSRLGAEVRIKQGSVIEESEVGEGTQIGPMAHLRPGSVIGRAVRIGNFVETKKARIGDGTKASHLTYVGDAEIGKNVNLGCGFITCNYDGRDKHKTIIADDVFVGSDTQTVAPVKIGRRAYIGSGSTITADIPPGALALTRAPLVIKKGWVKKRFSAPKKKSSPS